MPDIIKLMPGQVGGAAQVPTSKSLGHRAILAAALAEGTSQIDQISYSEDIVATIDVARQLGAVVEKLSESSLKIHGIAGHSEIKDITTIDCHESGSTLRFVVPILAALERPALFTGRGRLVERPMQVYYDLFDAKNVAYETTNGLLPLKVTGSLKGGEFAVDGSISSQFVTGLLMALPLLKEDSKLTVTGRLESRPYVDLTKQVLAEFGIVINEVEEAVFLIPGGQTYKPVRYTVEADASQAAFPICAAAICGKEEGVLIENLPEQTLQGDIVFLDVLKALGGRFVREEKGLRVYPAKLQGNLTMDVSACPDIVPILAVLGCYNQGEMHIVGAARLRYKESDRLSAITQELRKLGGQIVEESEGLRIRGGKLSGQNAALESHNDHRIAMSLAVAMLGAEGSATLHGANSVQKSWPTFWADFGNIKENK